MKRKSIRQIRSALQGYLFISPFFLAFLVFGLYPILYTLFLSFQKWDGVVPPSFIGWRNFQRLLQDPLFYKTIWNTFRIWICSFIPQMGMALLLAGLFTLNRIRGMKFFRASYYLPNLITAASVGLLFNLLFGGDKSVANHLLLRLGVISSPFQFFQNSSFVSGIASYILWWMWFGYTTIIIMAGMTTVDQRVYESAMIDGANKAQTFFYITLPMIQPTLLYLLVSSIIGGMQLFDVPATLTNGDGEPQKIALTTTMYVYNHGFKNHNFGYASAVSIGLFIIIVLLSALSYLLTKRREEERNA